jgi:hypothetical protein
LSKPSSSLLKSPPRSRLTSVSIFGGVTVVAVDDVVALALPTGEFEAVCQGLSGIGSSSAGTGGRCFFWPPNEKVRPADLRKPEFETLGPAGCLGTSPWCVLLEDRASSSGVKSADDGAVDRLLWRDELSVEAVFVVFDEPLPRFGCVVKPANRLSSTDMADTLVWATWCVFAANLAPPSKDFALVTSARSRTRNELPATGTSSRLFAVDLRLPKATGNLGI